MGDFLSRMLSGGINPVSADLAAGRKFGLCFTFYCINWVKNIEPDSAQI
jgi:hypothetical protein